jgi:iron-sulfur cluster repair protein YtfE (RIC family)
MQTSTQPIPQTTFNSATDYLSWDHDQLDAALADVLQMVDDGEIERADAHFEAFARRLRRHIRLEEDILFPVFERATGMIAGPTQVMRAEHRQIEAALEEMSQALAGGSAGAFRAGHAALISVLGAHNQKEERILYPMTDEALSDLDRLALTRQLENG